MPICYREIEAYARLMRIPIRPFEVYLIRELDKVAIRVSTTTEPSRKLPPGFNPAGDLDGMVDIFARRGTRKVVRAPGSSKPKQGGKNG